MSMYNILNDRHHEMKKNLYDNKFYVSEPKVLLKQVYEEMDKSAKAFNVLRCSTCANAKRLKMPGGAGSIAIHCNILKIIVEDNFMCNKYSSNNSNKGKGKIDENK